MRQQASNVSRGVSRDGQCNHVMILCCLSDLRSRIALEGDAISRAKEFLRRQTRSVQRRKVRKPTIFLGFV